MNMGNLRRIERKDDGGLGVAAEVKKVVDLVCSPGTVPI